MEKLLDHIRIHIEQPIYTLIQKDSVGFIFKHQWKEQVSEDRTTKGRSTRETHEKETELGHGVALLTFQPGRKL